MALIDGLVYSALTKGGRVVTDEQVRLLMSLLTQGIPQVTAAAKAGMSERTARKYARSGSVPSQAKVAHTWRTRPDPFVEVWPEVEALLRQDGGLQAKTIWTELNERHAGRFSAGQLRTLQRRLLAWRVTSGPDREVFFPQSHIPGEQAQSDFTDMRQLEVMIAGRLFPHLLYHFVLTYSNWESVSICPSESFESLSAGMQSALWRLGGAPLEHRTDNLSAATHELPESRGRDFTERYRELIDHYGLRASRNFPGNAHENGDIESANGHLKNAIDQRLRLRGSRAFVSREAYEGFLETCIQARNATRHARIEEERGHLRALPVRPLPAYRESYATVSRASAVRVLKHSYSVSSRLIGCQLRVRLHADIVELHYKGERVAVMERLIGATHTGSTTGTSFIPWFASLAPSATMSSARRSSPPSSSAAPTTHCLPGPTRPILSTCGSCTWRPATARRLSGRCSPICWLAPPLRPTSSFAPRCEAHAPQKAFRTWISPLRIWPSTIGCSARTMQRCTHEHRHRRNR